MKREPSSVIVRDPRRPGHHMALVSCWCGRAYTMTGEEAVRHADQQTHPCPAGCGKGSE